MGLYTHFPPCTPRPLTKPCPILSPADETPLCLPPRLEPTRLGAPGAFCYPHLHALFLGGALYTPPTRCPKAPWKALPHYECRRRIAPAPPTKAIAHPSRGNWGLWRPNLLAKLLGGALHSPPPKHSKNPHEAAPHSESRGRNAPVPHTKAIAHPSRGPWGLFAP